jgi:hypothetical protein
LKTDGRVCVDRLKEKRKKNRRLHMILGQLAPASYDKHFLSLIPEPRQPRAASWRLAVAGTPPLRHSTLLGFE